VTGLLLTKRWRALADWLASSSPCTSSSLLPGIPRERLRELLGEEPPEELVELYALAAGQRGGVERAAGIFDGYWFMPVDSVDGLKQTRENFRQAELGGASWAKPERFAFAKDFAGNYLCLEGGRVLELEDGKARYQGSLEKLLGSTLRSCQQKPTIDLPIEVRAVHEIYFDATRQRTVGDAVNHSLFESLHIRAEVVSIEAAFGHFDKRPETLFGLAIRIVGNQEGRRLEVNNRGVVDPYDQPVRGTRAGQFSGGGGPGYVVYAWSSAPLPERSRLRVELTDVQLRFDTAT
jgi:hypothetical protein